MIMKLFYVTARTATHAAVFAWLAYSSGQAAEDTANLFDEPCGITVIPEVR